MGINKTIYLLLWAWNWDGKEGSEVYAYTSLESAQAALKKYKEFECHQKWDQYEDSELEGVGNDRAWAITNSNTKEFSGFTIREVKLEK